MRIVMTGATGYIGAALAKHAQKHGHEVMAAARQASADTSMGWLNFELNAPEHFLLPPQTDVLFHLATQTSNVNPAAELQAAQHLLSQATQANARFIFISSQAASSDAPTAYGQSKWAIEQQVLAQGGVVVRVGQVYGGAAAGLFGILMGLARQWPLLPAFLPPPMVQPIHVDDVVEGLLRLAQHHSRQQLFCLAAVMPISFTHFLAAIARGRLRKTPIFLPIPRIMVSALHRLLPKEASLTRLQSLFNLPTMNTAADLETLALALRPLQSGMHPSGNGRRRQLLQEGRALFCYITKQPPSHSLLRRYVRAIEQLRAGAPLRLPALLLCLPSLLVWLDDPAARGRNMEFTWRLDAATLLAEATQVGAYQFMAIDKPVNKLSAVAIIGLMVVFDGFWRILRFFFKGRVA